jgi:sugar phosphate isomerase/epimerase
MKSPLVLPLFLLSACLVASAPAQDASMLPANARVAVIGDSITEQKLYSKYLECYLLACTGRDDITVFQFGWSGERADGFANRLANDLGVFHPTVATTCYGMNDGSYQAFNDGIGGTYEKNMIRIIEGLKAERIRFGHHNHAREFFKPERHGRTLEDILIDEGGDDLMMELDLYWIAHAGVSPEHILDRCHGRVPVIHLKDKEPFADSHDSRIAAVGEGSMDWKHIIPACERAGVDWYTMEQDTCPRDPFDCLQSSFDYMTKKKWEI